MNAIQPIEPAAPVFPRDRLIDCKGPPRVYDGDEVTFIYQRPDGSRYERPMVFRLFEAGRRMGETA